MARRHAINVPMKEMMFMAPEKSKKPSTSPSSSFIGSMLMKATVPITLSSENQFKNEDPERYTLMVVGDNNCGKTCLLKSFVMSDFEVDESNCGIFEECTVKVKIGTRMIEFMLWDLSGHEDYDGLRVELFQNADIYLVCFDIGNPASLENVLDVWIPEIQYVTPDVPFIMVGLKNDLRTDSNLEYYLSVPGIQNGNENEDSVGKTKAEKAAADAGAKEYIECCSKTKFNIEEVFKMAAHVLLCKNDSSYSLHNKSGSGFLSRYGRRRSTEVGVDKLPLKRGKLLFSSERSTRRGTFF